MNVSVVIRSYNEERHIGRLLAGIAEQTIAPQEVIVVDSGSSDRTVEIAHSFGARVVHIDKKEFTFGRALNVGCAAASGDILLFASAHVYPTYRNWIEMLLAPFVNPQVVLCYGRQRGNHLTKFSEHQVFTKWYPAISVCPQRNYFCNNANCAVRRNAWERQHFDETLSGLEDLAWAKAAQARGGWLAYQAQAEVVHVHEESWLHVRNRYRREAMAMAHIDEKARFSLLDFASLLAANVWADCREAARRRVLFSELKSILLFRFNQMWGNYLGHNGPSEVTAELRKLFYFPADCDESMDVFPELEPYRIDYEAVECEDDRHEAKIRSFKAAASR